MTEIFDTPMAMATKQLDIGGIVVKLVVCQFPSGYENELSRPLDKATISLGCWTDIDQVALYEGSSKHGTRERVEGPPSKSVAKIKLKLCISSSLKM